MAECIVYLDPNYEPGPGYRITRDVSDFRSLKRGPGSDWNDEVSSIKILSGTWQFFEHKDYQGSSTALGPGN
jgi:hypothetical protein